MNPIFAINAAQRRRAEEISNILYDIDAHIELLFRTRADYVDELSELGVIVDELH